MLESQTPSRDLAWRLAAWVSGLFWLAGVGSLLRAGLEPDAYMLMHGIQPRGYPVKEVGTHAAILTFECLLIFFGLLRTRRFPVRAPLLTSVMLFVIAAGYFVRLLHAHPVYGWHWMWLVGCSLLLFADSMITGIARYARALGSWQRRSDS